MRVEIGERHRYKAVYQLIERTTCQKCIDKDCENCIIKDVYDVAEEIEKDTYWKEYGAVCDNRRDKIVTSIDRGRKGQRKRWYP